MDGGAWWAAVHGVAQSWTRPKQLHFSLFCIGEGNGNPLQCSCLENPRDGGTWWAAVYGVAQGQTRLKWLSSSSICLQGFIKFGQISVWAYGEQKNQGQTLVQSRETEEGTETAGSFMATCKRLPMLSVSWTRLLPHHSFWQYYCQFSFVASNIFCLEFLLLNYYVWAKFWTQVSYLLIKQ